MATLEQVCVRNMQGPKSCFGEPKAKHLFFAYSENYIFGFGVFFFLTKLSLYFFSL